MFKLRGSIGVHRIFSLFASQCPLTYSTRSTAAEDSDIVADYLVNSLGFSREQALSKSTKVRPLKSTENADLVMDFFTQSGFDKSQIKSMVYNVPRLLSVNVDRTLKPKIRFLQDLGLSVSDVVRIVCRNPSIIDRGLLTHFIPMLEFLKSVFTTDDNVIRAIKRSPRILCYSEYLRQNIELLRNYGIPDERIRMFSLKNPNIFLWSPEWIKDVITRVEEKLQIPHDSGMFLYGVRALAGVSQKNLRKKFLIFKSYGWTDSDILTMGRINPNCLTTSDKKIRTRLNFFMKELGHGPGYLASRPVLLRLSLEKRVLPRNAVLQFLEDKMLIKRKPSFYSTMLKTDSNFLGKFVLPFKDEAPSLYEIYIKSRGSAPKVAG
ncbi:hypothetical protein Ancab_035680 [Ancistrocladus abbreviatus]